MAYNGTGTFSRPVSDYVFNTTISETDVNTEMDGIATGLSTCLLKDGTQAATAIIPFASGIQTNLINENTAASGVTVDGVLVKDGGITLGTAGTLIFEGATADAFETTLTVADPTADRTITLPDSSGTMLVNVVEDTTPQLGGDLDLNGNNIDFPTTANISDCLDEDNMASDSATALATQQSIKAYADSISALIVLPRGYMSGLALSNNGTDAAHDIDIAAGECRDTADGADITLAAFTKQIDATWSAGTNQGGLSSSLTAPAADTWYHVHAIIVSGSADVGFDTSVTAANLVTDHSATAYRRLGSVLTDGSANILAFAQYDDTFIWAAQEEDLDDTDSDANTAAETLTLTVPTGVSVRAIFNALANSGETTEFRFFHPDNEADTVPMTAVLNAGPGYDIDGDAITARLEVFTNTSAQIKVRSTADNSDLSIRTIGWVDHTRRS